MPLFRYIRRTALALPFNAVLSALEANSGENSHSEPW